MNNNNNNNNNNDNNDNIKLSCYGTFPYKPKGD